MDRRWLSSPRPLGRAPGGANVTAYGVIPYGPVAEGAIARMKPADAKVYLAVCAHVRAKTWEASPGVGRLAKLTGLSERAVSQAIGRLGRIGLVEVAPGGGRSHTNTYRLTGNPERPFTLSAPGNPECPFALSAPETLNAGALNPERARPETLNAGARHKEKNYRKNPRKNMRAAGKPPPDARVKVFLDFFCKTYAETLGRPYIVSGGKDGAVVKRLLHVLDGNGLDALAELQQAARNMLADSWGKDRASIGLLSSQLNAWRGNPTPRQAARGSTFTPGTTDGTDYNSLARKF